jgi:hypothetical protein
MYIDHTFYNKLQELHTQKFDWQTNNCGFFVGKMLQFMYKKDFLIDFADKCTDEKTSFALIEQKGGWNKVLNDAGLVKREDKSIYVGDVVLCENAIGIYDGTKALFAGGVFRRKPAITSAYYYMEK